MGGFGEILWDAGTWGGPAPEPPDAAIPASELLGRLYLRLHAGAAADLTWWDVTELLGFADRAFQRLARLAGVFVKRTATSTAAAQATYALPPDHLSTLQASYDGAALRPASTAELGALDPDYSTTPGAPKRWYQDTIGLAAIGLAKVPTEIKSLAILHHYAPEAVTSLGSLLAVPEPVAVYLSDLVLADAYRGPGEGAMPEVAAFLDQKAQLLEQLFQEYWGVAQ